MILPNASPLSMPWPRLRWITISERDWDDASATPPMILLLMRQILFEVFQHVFELGQILR